MRWIAKAILKKVLSSVPAGNNLDSFIQLRVTKSLPCSALSFENSVKVATRHIDHFKKYAHGALEHAKFMEFGAGWDLIGPLTFYRLGVRHQTLSDIRPHLHLGLVNNTLARLEFPMRLGQLEDLTDLGIRYVVESVAISERFDCIVSTSTMEHIPSTDIPPLLESFHDLLGPGGLISFSIDTRDHFSDFDSTIGPDNFLKFSDVTWRLLNSPLHYQNRLRPCDYIRMIEGSGFRILHEKTNIKGNFATGIHLVATQATHCTRSV
jgi:SAM-dependent methyltransferase